MSKEGKKFNEQIEDTEEYYADDTDSRTVKETRKDKLLNRKLRDSLRAEHTKGGEMFEDF